MAGLQPSCDPCLDGLDLTGSVRQPNDPDLPRLFDTLSGARHSSGANRTSGALREMPAQLVHGTTWICCARG
jgi:hypothetical protein